MFTNTFSVPEKQMFQIYLLRTHPRFSSATWPLYFPQSLRYPLGRDYSVTPSLSVEREIQLSCCRTTSSREEIRIEALRTMTSKVSLHKRAREDLISQGYLTPSTQLWAHARYVLQTNQTHKFQKASGLF